MADIAPGSRSDVIRRLIKLFESMDVDGATRLFTPDASYRFANFPPAVGIDNIRKAAVSSHLEAIKGTRFDILGMWEMGDVVVCQMDIHYTRTDDTTLTLPCTDVFRMQGNLIKDMRIYMDPTPLFA